MIFVGCVDFIKELTPKKAESRSPFAPISDLASFIRFVSTGRARF